MNNRLKLLIYSLLGRKTADKLFISRIESSRRKNNDLTQKIKNNTIFLNTHIGERCFILGNGPSLKDVDLELLEKEFVFTVNNFSLVDNYKKAKTNVHLWADLSFFELREDQKYNHEELIENYLRIAEEQPICFVPDSAYDFIVKNKLDEVLNINYFSLFSSIDSKIRSHFDLSRAISCYSTVVQYAISIAIYMGFKEIYLLGCDCTNIISLLNSAMNIRSEGMHAYKNDDVNERYKELLEHWSMKEAFYDQYFLFEGFETLKAECDKRDIKLVNCSSSTLINELPRANFPDILCSR